MTSLIKNQVLKHLTKFFKDLAPEQLQLSALKGSCELSNLQLEEKVLMELLSFPAWVRINKAICDQLVIRIPWTKIKSVPIQMNLNEVTVEVEVCEEFRDISVGEDGEANNIANLINTQAPGKYGFVDRVIDGITVTVNNILITFKSKLMSATFNLSRVLLESRCPNWKQGELSLTRIKDPKRGQILLFKVVEWQTMRLEAKCLTDPNQAPLRLITNHAQCQLTIKKNLDDCSVIAARIFLNFEDILWVLTFAQFISAASFVEYVFSLIKRSPVSKQTGPLQDSQSSSSSSGCPPTPNQSLNASTLSSSSYAGFQQSGGSAPLISPLHTSMTSDKGAPPPMLSGNLSSASLSEQKFLCYDLVETSLHLYIDKVDAHLYDDIETKPSSGSARETGGALQTTLDQIQVDCYPYSRAMSDRRHWLKWFDPSPNSRRQWMKNHFADFDLSRARKHEAAEATSDIKGFEPTGVDKILTENGMAGNQPSNSNPAKPQTAFTNIDEHLLSLTVLIKIKDYCMHCVATNHSARSAVMNKFIQTDKDYHMPSEMPALYLELNYFYYFDAINRMMVYENVPDPLAFMHLSPTKLLFDSPTLVFLNSFHVNLSKAFVHLNDLFPQETTAPNIHCRVEILMPQIILPAKKSQGDQPVDATSTSSLLVKSGKITLCSSIYDKEVIAKLMSSIEKLKENPSQPINLGGANQGSFARKDNTCSGDWTKVWNSSLIGGTGNEFTVHNQLWAVQFEPVWMDFMNYDVDQLASGQRLEPIVEPVNAYAFIHLDLSSTYANKSIQDISVQLDGTTKRYHPNATKKRDVISILFTVLDGSILANMDKVQFGFLQRLGMHAEKLIQQIREDASSIIQLDTVVEDTLEINLTGYVKEIKARLILDKKVSIDLNQSSSSAQQQSRSNISSFNTPLQVNSKPLTPFTTVENISAAPKSPGSTSNTATTTGFFNNLSSISNPFDGKSSMGGNEEFLSEAAYSSLPAAVIDGETFDNADELDECVEVADDASCLIFGDSSAAPAPTASSESRGQATSAVNGDKASLTSQTGAGSSSSTSESTAVAGTSASMNSARSLTKSPIGEELLINLNEIEQSSQLFAKMDIKPKTPTASFQESQPVSEKTPTNLSTTTETASNIQGQAQQQDIETESISYLELSMSQLMVRRITETKRRQKF